MLEDESGRVRLVGKGIADAAGTFVTGESSFSSRRGVALDLIAPRYTLVSANEAPLTSLPSSLTPPLPQTGTIMAALGAETPSGDFEVLEFCFAGLPPQADVKPASSSAKEESDGEWVALVSGLEMGSGNAENETRCMMLAEWLSGEVGGVEVSFRPCCRDRSSLYDGR